MTTTNFEQTEQGLENLLDKITILLENGINTFVVFDNELNIDHYNM